jgi:hypothetical protein
MVSPRPLWLHARLLGGNLKHCRPHTGELIMIAVQYLEGGSHSAQIPREEARARLRAAFDHLPLARVLLGWNLPTPVVEACAEVCAAAQAQLYLWHPLLTGNGRFRPQPEWRTIGLNGAPVAGFNAMPEFTFICPNRPAARKAVLQYLSDVIAPGYYQGVFLDRMRFPSPAADPARDLACFCEDCHRVAWQVGVDLAHVQRHIRQLLATPEGQRVTLGALLAPPGRPEAQSAPEPLAQFLTFRQHSISECVIAAAKMARARGLAVGLDCFAPTLTRLVGQDLTALRSACDWIKVMTYLHAFGPACIPFEILGLANWLISAGGASEQEALTWLAETTGWPLPHNRQALRGGALDAALLTMEIQRGRAAGTTQLLVGIELVELPGVAELNAAQIDLDLAAVRAGGADGLVLSWDLWHIPLERLDLVSAF